MVFFFGGLKKPTRMMSRLGVPDSRRRDEVLWGLTRAKEGREELEKEQEVGWLFQHGGGGSLEAKTDNGIEEWKVLAETT